MQLADITPVILSYNEQDNIARALASVAWAKRVVVVDSLSTDNTLDIVRSFKNTAVFQRPFDTHEDQWNYGLAQVTTPWVLSLDADYVVTEALMKEMESLNVEDQTGFAIGFQYCIGGKPLRGTILPPRVALFARNRATYVNDGHTQLLAIEGHTPLLRHTLLHDDRKPLSRWLASQDKYMVLEVQKLFSGQKLSFSDRLRKKVFFAPWLVFFYCLLFKGGLLDGKRGWYYAYQRLLAESLLAVRIIEHLMSRKKDR